MRMRLCCAVAVMGLAIAGGCGTNARAQTPAPVAHWTFSDGRGDVLRDVGGKNLNGRIVNAVWAKTAFGTGLRFDGKTAHVDCGAPKELALTGDLTLTAWVQLEAAPFPNHDTNWNIVESEIYAKSGYMLRVNGDSARLCFRANQDGPNQAAFSRAMLSNGVPQHVAVVRRGQDTTFFIDGQRDVTFATNDPLPPKSSFHISSPSQAFHGMIYDVRVYDRALSDGDVLGVFAQDAKRFAKEISWTEGKVGITPFLRVEEKELTIEADFRGIMPLPRDAKMVAVMASADGREVSRKTVARTADTLRQHEDVAFDLSAVAAGEYAVRFLSDPDGGEPVGTMRFTWPPAPPKVPAPAEWTAPALPTQTPPPAFTMEATEEGGLVLRINRREVRVDSRLGRPGGGENGLVTGPSLDNADPAWTVTRRVVGPDRVEITAQGSDYRLERRVVRSDHRVLITDTLHNRRNEPIGIPFMHHVARRDSPLKGFVSGYGSQTAGRKDRLKFNPTVFVTFADMGLGLAALDDVFIVQSTGGFDGGGAEFGSRELALDAGAAITLEWAIYLNATGDYYDFVNAVRRDEGRNFVTVRGGFTLAWKRGDRRFVPPKDYLVLRGAKHVIAACLSGIPDDPQISLEGIEFMQYPQEMALLREHMLAIRAVDPEVFAMFHIAHSLYTTDRPEEVFPDSRIIAADGSQPFFKDDAFHYISRERQAQNWRFWAFYPTLDNSLGKALLRSADVMTDELGCTGAFLDGFLDSYGGDYTYDRWDGCTADLDPQTHRILRKKGSLALLQQPALVAFVERMKSKGAVVIANGATVTRTSGRLDIITDKEVVEGPDVHLAQTPITMGNAGALHSELDVYRDVLAKLHWGSLYMYYGEPDLKHPSVPQQMYPITVNEIGEGIVRGAERIVTARPGVYGWPGERGLHFVYRYDARGRLALHEFTTTVDAAGVRTEVPLGRDECAVVKRIPLSVNADKPLNVIVTRYDAQSVELLLNARGPVEIVVRSGDLPVPANTAFSVRVGHDTRTPTSDADGVVRIPLLAEGLTPVTIAAMAREAL